MLKTYLYIPEELDRQVRELAKLQKLSKAEVIRQALEKGLDVVEQQGSASAEILLKLTQLGKKYKIKGPKNSSVRIDELLWGKEWNKK